VKSNEKECIDGFGKRGERGKEMDVVKLTGGPEHKKGLYNKTFQFVQG